MDFSLIAAESFSWTSLSSWLAILKMVAGLGTVIFVHELGHFFVAKACGVKCEKFYLGFDAFDIRIGDFVLVPKKLVSFQWGETEYGIGIVPLGGYVKMLGQDDNPSNAARERERSMIKSSELEDTESSSSDQESTDRDASPENEEFILDPRSYQAKSVPQRMAIISAGVIMNLIFAVIFAAIAYGVGVKHSPTVIGGVLPGGPAYVEDIQPGWEVVQIGENGRRREHLRFHKDLVSAIAYNGTKQELTLVFKTGSDAEKTVSLQPNAELVEMRAASLPQIGILPSSELVLGEHATVEGSAADKAGLMTGDRIVELRVDGQTIAEPDYPSLKSLLAQFPDQTVTFVVERPNDADDSSQRVDIEVGTNPTRFTGLIMETGPVVAVQKGSPAEEAGIEVGDILLSVDDQPVGHFSVFEERMRKAALEDKQLKVTVKRVTSSKEATLDLDIKPRMPRTRYQSGYADLPVAIDELGLCFKVSNTIGSVEEGSSARSEGLQAGDVITEVQFVPASEESKAREVEAGFAHEAVDISDAPNSWPLIFSGIQMRLPDTKLKVTVQRDGKTEVAELTPTYSDEHFERSRGFFLTPLEETHQAESFGEAISLGFRETKENAMLVFTFLKKLATNEISPINLGGPGTIAVGATQEAMYGTPRLLLFLTLLSANLAVVNFLPIPVLDGGHMVFLMWEAIFRKPLSERVMVTLTMAGLLFIVSLMLFVISLDVWRFLPL